MNRRLSCSLIKKFPYNKLKVIKFCRSLCTGTNGLSLKSLQSYLFCVKAGLWQLFVCLTALLLLAFLYLLLLTKIALYQAKFAYIANPLFKFCIPVFRITGMCLIDNNDEQITSNCLTFVICVSKSCLSFSCLFSTLLYRKVMNTSLIKSVVEWQFFFLHRFSK